MLYRVMADMCFQQETDAQTLFSVIKKVMNKTTKLIISSTSPDRAITETPTYVEIQRCYHDEKPFKPCEVIQRIEV